MQRVITLRASQRDLNNKLDELVKMGWKVISVTKGSELGRVGFSYKWTVVLEIPNGESYEKVNEVTNRVDKELSGKSMLKTICMIFALLAGIIGLGLIVFYALI